jgi:hypothetical protein
MWIPESRRVFHPEYFSSLPQQYLLELSVA